MISRVSTGELPSLGLPSSMNLCCRSTFELPADAIGQDALALRVPDRPLHGLPHGTLTRVVAAVELPRVDEVAVVRDLHPVVRGPDEPTYRRLGIDEACIGDDLDRCDLHARSHAGDTDTVDRGCDRAGDVRAVGRRCRVPGGLSRVHDSTQAGRTLVLGDLRDQVGMGARDTAIQHADDDVRASRGHRVRRGDSDLSHVPLQAEQRLARRIAGGLLSIGADGLERLVLLERSAETCCRGDCFHAGARGYSDEVGVGRTGDENPDLAVVRDDATACGGNSRRSLGRRVSVGCEDEIRDVWSRGCRRRNECTACRENARERHHACGGQNLAVAESQETPPIG